ncbi:hypothetical protein [Azospira restricta]|uniref:Uncharacterized protein n=1 Tax=Azospira restricta TaxID=404405 RepID=A0A974SRM2_9RHOO|nr:hypothetical protein [Azospira restricta]QRJ65230.1 hypothetical protein IWH25_07835 [Azospira restricta]
MRPLLLALSAALSLVAVPALAANPVQAVTESGSGVAQRLVELSTKDEVAATDPRVAQAQAQLKKAAKATGESEQAVAAACTRAARFIFDATKSPATPLDVLDALAAKGAGRPMNDSVGAYVAARRNAAGKTHAEAMAAMK